MSIHWQPISSRVAFSFWQTLRNKIINAWKLDSSKKSICGSVSQTSDSCVLEVNDASFVASMPALEQECNAAVFCSVSTPQGGGYNSKIMVHGDLILCNTAHEFKTRDKQALLAETTADFCLLIYPNIKDSQFLYWFGFPADVLQGDSAVVSDLYNWRVLDFKQSGSTVEREVVFPFPVWQNSDTYTFPWFARRALAQLSSTVNRLVLRCLNDVVLTIDVTQPAAATGCRTTIGWEPDARGIMCPRRADLRTAFDPRTMADDAARLNLELMRWRMLPGLDLDGLGGLKCLLIGAGTLGCHIARNLIAWGVRHITFVDGGRVALSNPVRQSLYEFGDAAKECWKAQAAAEALRRIHPSMATEGHGLRVPMPGHPVHDAERTEIECDIDKLEQLIRSHDVVFLLTDTRESRWLPSLMARSAGKLAITVALGFDTWLVMRHGIGESVASEHGNNGCYFCLDCVAPKNTTLNRTLDQQCTVTRPGVAPIASAIAVELLVSLLHHPRRFQASADHGVELTDATVSPLGIVPHVIRGFMSHIHTMTSAAECSKYCSACSDAVVSKYKLDRKAFIFQVCSDESVLEKIVGLGELVDAVDFDDC